MWTTAPAAGAQTDVIRGRITGPDSASVPNANVTLIALPEHVVRRTPSNDKGMFMISSPRTSGSYTVEIIALGYAPRRFELKRIGDSNEFAADVQLDVASTTLQPVRVRAARRRPDRGDDDTGAGGPDRAVNPAAVSVEKYGDLAAMASSMLGADAVPSSDGRPAGFSVLGLSPEQNATTLNGLAFGGTELPTNAPVSMMMSTGPYDVSRGGFSGAQFTLRSRRGTNYITRLLSGALDAPATQWSDPVASQVGQEYSRHTIGGLFSGPLVYDKAFYALSFQLSRRSNDFRTLFNTDAAGLNAAGIAADSVTQLLGILRRLAIPVNTSGSLRQQVGESGSVFGAFDVVAPLRTSGQSFNLTYAGNWNRQTPSYLMPTELPTRGSDFTSVNGTIQGRHTNYFGFGVLSETLLGVNASNSGTTPFLRLPSGNVFVQSALPDGTTGIQLLTFGGAPGSSRQTTSQVSGRNQLSWYSLNEKHLISISSELRHESAAQLSAYNELGTFNFDSLGALAAALPSSFSRSLSAQLRHEGQWVGALSIGDRYTPSDAVELQYGVRVDANRFVTAPLENAAVTQALGKRTDVVPTHIYASPRIGFSWIYGAADTVGVTARFNRYQRASVQGGIGVFQSLPLVTSIGSALDNTGLPSAVQRFSCFGAATPRVEWSSYSDTASIPSTCAGGSDGIVFANSSPNVLLYDPAYRSPRSIRGNLLWRLPMRGVVAYVEGTYSLNLDEPMSVDLNFSDSSRFTLPNEGGRQVFVQRSLINPASGTIDWRASRLSQNFSHVTSLRSDARSESRLFSVRLNPKTPNALLDWSLSYVHSNVREKTAGFSSTDGDPVGVSWARADRDWRREVQYTLSINPFNFVRATWTGTLRSGFPYTPTVSGDVNGDGYWNDRAFIFSSADAGMRTLLDNSSAAVRGCLSAQEGKVALRNSCEGPWTSTANLSIQVNPVRLRLPRHATISLQLSNPTGAFDRWLHGASALHGWGDVAMPSSTLLYVRGFDPDKRQYTYEVDQRFGTTDRSLAAQWGPPRLTVMFAMDAGPAQERQMLIHDLDRGRKAPGNISTAASLRQAFGTQMDLPNPMAEILRSATTLDLTSAQADSIAALNASYATFLRSVWNPVWTELSTLPKTYDNSAAYASYRGAREASVDFLIQLAPLVKELLTVDQRRLLFSDVRDDLDLDYLRSIRSGTASQGTRGMMR